MAIRHSSVPITHPAPLKASPNAGPWGARPANSKIPQVSETSAPVFSPAPPPETPWRLTTTTARWGTAFSVILGITACLVAAASMVPGALAGSLTLPVLKGLGLSTWATGAIQLGIAGALTAGTYASYLASSRADDLSHAVAQERKAERRAERNGEIPVRQPSILTEKRVQSPAIVNIPGFLGGAALMAAGITVAILGGGAPLALLGGAALTGIGFAADRSTLFAERSRQYAESTDAALSRKLCFAEAQIAELSMLQAQMRQLQGQINATISDLKDPQKTVPDAWQSKIRTERLRAASLQMQGISETVRR